MLRSYIVDEKGKEHIFMFAPEGWIIADIESLEFDHPAELFIECIEDSVVVQFEKKNLALVNDDLPTIIQHVGLLYRRIGVLQRRVIMMLKDSARIRYENFLETYPELPNRVPQKMIASYLGITPEALSKIRNERVKSK